MLFPNLINVERPISRRSSLVITDRLTERSVASLANDRDDQSHLRVDAAKPVDRGDPADREHVSGGSHIHAVLL